MEKDRADSVALFVDFDDVYASLKKKYPSVSAGLLAQSLRRTARAFGPLARAYVCAEWSRNSQTGDLSPREAFEQEGFSLLSADSRHETFWRLEDRIFHSVYDEDSRPKTLIIVTNDGHFAPIVDRLRSLAYEVRLWTAGEIVTAQFDSLDVTITPLEELLDFQDKPAAPSMTVALFVDMENIVISLSNLGFVVNPEVLAKSFRGRALRQGSLVEAYAYADWQKLPPVFDAAGKNLMDGAQRIFELNSIETRYLITVAGKNSADMRMADDIRDLLEGRTQPDVFIIASGDRDFTPVIDTLARAHKSVTVWGVDGCTSASLSSLAEVEYIQSFVLLARRDKALPIAGSEQTPTAAATSPIPVSHEDGMDSCPTMWTKLVMLLDDLMIRNGWKWVSLSRATNELAALKDFGPTEEDARYVLNQAVARGIVQKERIQNPNPNYPDQFVWAFRPAEDSIAVKTARIVAERVVEIMTYGLGRMEYIAFSYLQSQLARDRDLNQLLPALDDEGRIQWINFLISEGVIDATRRPHHRNPGDLVTALTLPNNASSVFKQTSEIVSRPALKDNGRGVFRVIEGQNDSIAGMWKRLVVSIDSFTLRSSLSWAPLITLRQRLSLFGKDDMEAVLRGAQESGDVIVQEYPNPNKPYPTKGASLNHDSPAVKAVLDEKNRVLLALVRLHRAGESFTVPAIHDALSGICAAPDAWSDLWLSIFVNEKILSCAVSAPGQVRSYHLNTEHLAVRCAAEPGGHDAP